MKKIIALSLMIFVAFIPEVVLAHPGHDGDHGDSGYTITHYFTQPSHIVVSLLCIAVVVAVVRYTKKSEQAK